MKLNFLVAPDFAPEHFAGWHMLNTVVQRRSGLHLHLLTPADATEQEALLNEDRVDVIYANPFDAAEMIRARGYLPFARPLQRYDEMVIACGTAAAAQRVEDLRPGCTIATTRNHDVKLIGLRLLEPANLTENDVQWRLAENYQATARACIKGEVDAGFFLTDAYAALSKITRSQLRTLVESAISDISHVLLLHPRAEAQLAAIADALLGVGSGSGDSEVLNALGLPNGFVSMTRKEAEFMIDLMDTLRD